MSAPRVAVALHGHVAVITMQDAEHHNALAPSQVEAMLAALAESRLSARGVVIASGGKHFCAGADIQAMLKGDLLDPDREAPAHSPIHLFRAVTEDPRPILAVVDGLAMGGGMELTLACDFVLATERARFALPEVNLGVLPRTALVRLPAIVGPRKALELIMTRRRFDADEAYRLGLVNRVIPSTSAIEAAVAFMAEIVTAPPAVLAGAKRALGSVAPDDWAGIHTLLRHLDPREWREGFTAFLQKRSPDYDALWREFTTR